MSRLTVWNDWPFATPCCIYSTVSTDPALTVTLPAHVQIEFVVIIPSDQAISSVLAW
jgi:hypothetical protein